MYPQSTPQTVGIVPNMLPGQSGIPVALQGTSAFANLYAGAQPAQPPIQFGQQTQDPLLSLTPEQRADFSKQMSAGLATGKLSDQASIDKFKLEYISGLGEKTNIPGASAAAAPSVQLSAYQQNPAATAAIEALGKIGVNIGTVTDRLLAESGTIQSGNEAINSFIQQAITAQTQAMSANRASVEAQFNREYDYSLQKLQAQKESLLEQGRGGATGTYGLQLVDKEIEKSLRDLESRKQQAILEGDAKAFDKISDLQLKSLEFQMQNKRDYFEQLRAGAGLMGQQASLMADIARVAQGMTNDQLDYEYKQASLNLSAAQTLTDSLTQAAQVKYYEAQAREREGYPASPGWFNYQAEKTESEMAASAMAEVKQKIDSGMMSETEAYADLLQRAHTRANVLGPVASKEAVLGAYGFSPDSTFDSGRLEIGNFILTPQGTIEKDSGWFDWLFESPKETPNIQPLGSQINPWSMQSYQLGPTEIDPSTGEIISIGNTPVVKKKITQADLNTAANAAIWGNLSQGIQSLLGTTIGIPTAYASTGSEIQNERGWFGSLARDLMWSKPITYDRDAYEKAQQIQSTGLIDRMIQGIAKMEGSLIPGNRGHRNNNPGNLKFSGQPGATKDKDGFAVFSSLRDGTNALKNQIVVAATGTSSVYKPEMTLYEFFAKYAPAKDKNNPKKYAEFIAQELGVSPQMQIKYLVKNN